jgi:fucose permease
VERCVDTALHFLTNICLVLAGAAYVRKGAPTRTSTAETKLTIYRFAIAISFFAILLIGANDGAFGVLLPSIRTQYGVTNATVGLLFLFSTLGYLIASFNNGVLVATFGQGRALLIGALLFLVAALLISIKLPFLLLLPLMLVLGFGVAMLDAGLNTYIAILPRSVALLNYFHAFYGVGAWLGPLFATGILAIGLGWNSLYLLWGGLGILVAVGIWHAFRQTAAEKAEEGSPSQTRGIFVEALKVRTVWLAALFLLFYVGTEVTLGGWSFSFLTEERHGDPVLMGWVVSGYWLGLTLGRLLLGRVTLALGEKVMITLCLGGVALGILLVWLLPFAWMAAFGLFLTGFSLGPLFPTMIALTSRLVPSRLLASAVGFLTSLGSMGGALFAWLTGNLAQFTGLWILLPFMLVTTACMVILWQALQMVARRL